ncbi:hypothetical protein LTR64_001765 [Lithohypha guttulata]|uniref:uncharacterized protein n=1 Tax=Lithohypha guttulata TaxID=1690604 RepID=UPI002DDEB6AE|nr:hypothetical protein LTR51_003959 [Lithohypha guttulata]
MPNCYWRIKRLFRRKKTSRSFSPSLSPYNPGSFQPDSDHESYGVQRKPLPLVPNHPDSYHRPAELEVFRRDAYATAVPRNQQPYPAQQYAEQQRLAEEARLAQVLQENEAAAKLKARVDAEKREKRLRKRADAERRSKLEKEHNASAENIRRLRELIRERYALDIDIWQKRNVQRANRKMIVPRCEKADAILLEIRRIVDTWDRSLFNDQEWDMVNRIKAALCTKELENGDSNEPAIWGDLPPWDRRDQDEAMTRRQVF